jgi:hypothetical protein
METAGRAYATGKTEPLNSKRSTFLIGRRIPTAGSARFSGAKLEKAIS